MARPARKSFPDFKTPTYLPKGTSNYAKPLGIDSDSTSGAFGFFRDLGVRETIESVVVAIMLALIFRVFLAEAFIIPTGSMAPSLKGAHKEITCDESGFTYAVGAPDEQRIVRGEQPRITSTFCPITQNETVMRLRSKEHQTFSGDRILVNKFIYELKEPERYDVIVFKYPNNGKQNYIKRLIGLPGDNLLIENGDIYLMHQQADGSWEREITRKSPAKLRTTLQIVDDTHHIGKRLKEAGWPLRWQQFTGSKNWNTLEVGGHPIFSTTGEGGSGWLRYRHFRPNKSDWNTINDGRRPTRYANLDELPAGSLISDHYAYNDAAYGVGMNRFVDGLHWVGDIGVELDIDVKSDNGSLMLDIVEGGAHFICEIDVASGQATIHCDHDRVQFLNGQQQVAKPAGSTTLKRPGKYKILYMNADDRIYLWVNDRLVNFDAAEYRRDEIAIPTYSTDDPGDAEPIGIASKDLDIEVSRLKVVRDLYYTSVRGDENQRVGNETGNNEFVILDLLQNPTAWNSPSGLQIFSDKKGATKPMFQLQRGVTSEKDQFLPMGDNSPQSSDGRIWDGPNFVERDMLIGRAVFVYWPRPLNEPVPFFPNFKDMRFIR